MRPIGPQKFSNRIYLHSIGFGLKLSRLLMPKNGSNCEIDNFVGDTTPPLGTILKLLANDDNKSIFDIIHFVWELWDRGSR